MPKQQITLSRIEALPSKEINLNLKAAFFERLSLNQ